MEEVEVQAEEMQLPPAAREVVGWTCMTIDNIVDIVGLLKIYDDIETVPENIVPNGQVV